MFVYLSEINRPHAIESLSTPLVMRHHWVFDAKLLDFTLVPIEYLEETTGPTITLAVGGAPVRVPGGWSIVVVDRETYTVDAVPVTACAAFEHDALVFGPEDGKPSTAPARVDGWEPRGTVVCPAVDRGRTLVHAIGPAAMHGRQVHRGVLVGPHDVWRHIQGKTVGDLFG
jgi:hypothetical protein